MKEKLKGFWEEHGEYIAIGMIAFGSGLIGIGIGHGLGYGKALQNVQTGLNACCLVNPDLKGLLEEASKKVQEQLG